MDRFCLYIHKKKIDDTPFYVGIGVKGRPYRKDGQVIKEWGSIQDAQNETGIMNISYVCLGKRNKAGGFGWEFKLV